jgi:hypothetical protein
LGLGSFVSVSSTFTQSVGLLGQGISPLQGRYLHTGQNKQNKRTQTFMPQAGFERMIPLFERTNTVHASDSATTLIGKNDFTYRLFVGYRSTCTVTWIKFVDGKVMEPNAKETEKGM